MNFRFLQRVERDHISDTSTLTSSERVAAAIRAGLHPTDAAFDQFLPRELRAVSDTFWTPLAAVLRAARWLDEYDVRSLVDVGSGCGKFCVALALAGRRRRRIIGVEQRPRLVAAARDLAWEFGVHDRVEFLECTFGGNSPTPEADAYYFYNSFGENIFESHDHLDAEVELSHARYERDIKSSVQLLKSAREGTHLVTYNGFGGRVPPCYEQLLVDQDLPNVLGMWRKSTNEGK